MATLKDVSQSIRKGDWAATIDLEDAYLHEPIARVTEGSSGSGGKAEVFSSVGSHSVLLLGPSRRSASLPVVAMCRAKGIRLIAYLDNFLVLARNWRPDFSHQYSIRLFRPGWIPANLEEMPSATQTEVRILVPAVGLEGIASNASSGQDHKIFVD